MNIDNYTNESYWNNIYINIKDNEIKYDLWLDKYKTILKECKNRKVIDLGCGTGNNSLYLSERGFSVTACDYSEEALKIINKNLPQVKTLEFDLTHKFPFEDDSIKLIIADLSLHYFTEETTKIIFEEIKRVLLKDGYLIFRVNSVTDYSYGAGTGIEIEKHFYDTKYGYKRFFDEEDIRHFCSGWNILYISENMIDRYGMKKYTYEVVLKKHNR